MDLKMFFNFLFSLSLLNLASFCKYLSGFFEWSFFEFLINLGSYFSTQNFQNMQPLNFLITKVTSCGIQL
jgi:hypothetical protein